MKKFTPLALCLSVLFFTPTYAVSDQKCTSEQMKVLNDREFIENFLSVYPTNICRTVEIFEKGSKKKSCKASIKITESNEVKDCSILSTSDQND